MLLDSDIQNFLDTQKKGEGFLILATGISCCGRKEEFLPKFVKLCKKRHKKVKIYDIGDEIPQFIWEATRTDIIPRNILALNQLTKSVSQYGILRILCYQIRDDLKEYNVVIVNLHTRFYWKHGSLSIPVFNQPFIHNLLEFNLKPDLIVCFLDNAKNIFERMKEHPRWKDERINETQIYMWQNEEVNATKSYLFLTQKRINFFVMPILQPPETLFYLLFEPWRPIIYAQMPITNIQGEKGSIDPEKLKVILSLVEELRKLGIVFSPLTIETGAIEAELLKEMETNPDILDTIIKHIQTGWRDDEMLVPQCQISLSFHVEIVFTFGVVDETVSCSQLGREPWTIFPGNLSPFQPYRIDVRRIFRTAEDCLRFFTNEFMPEIWKKWSVFPPRGWKNPFKK